MEDELKAYEEQLKQNREKIMKDFDRLSNELRKGYESEYEDHTFIFFGFSLLLIFSIALNILLIFALIGG